MPWQPKEQCFRQDVDLLIFKQQNGTAIASESGPFLGRHQGKSGTRKALSTFQSANLAEQKNYLIQQKP